MLLDNLWGICKPDRGLQFLLYLISHTDPKTQIFNKTYKEISKDLDISEPTISKYFKKLESLGSIERVCLGSWRVKLVMGVSDTCDGPDIFVTRGFVPKR